MMMMQQMQQIAQMQQMQAAATGIMYTAREINDPRNYRHLPSQLTNRIRPAGVPQTRSDSMSMVFDEFD